MGREVDFHEGGLSTLNCCHPTLSRRPPPPFLGRAVSRAPGARRRHWGTINDYCRDYYRRSGEQAPLELFGGQFLPVHVVLCVQAARVYVPPLFLVSRESMHSPPTIHRYHYLSASLRSFVHPSLSNPSFVRPLSLSTLSILSLSLFIPLTPLARSSLSLKYCRYEQINCTRLIRR